MWWVWLSGIRLQNEPQLKSLYWCSSVGSTILSIMECHSMYMYCGRDFAGFPLLITETVFRNIYYSALVDNLVILAGYIYRKVSRH